MSKKQRSQILAASCPDRGVMFATRFTNPLVVPLNAEPAENKPIYDERSWKSNLQRYYGKKGAALSRAIHLDGYDGIVVVDLRTGETSKIVDLTWIGAPPKCNPIGARLDDPDLFARVASVEGERWAASDRRGGSYTLTGLLEAWRQYVAHAHEWGLDRFEPTLHDHTGVVYGDGGISRYVVRGEELVLDGSSTHEAKRASAKAQGIRVINANPVAHGYAYHVTFANRLSGIAERGLVPVGGREGSFMGRGGYAGYGDGKIFFTAKHGIGFWYHKAEQAATDLSDDPFSDGYTPVVLRAPMPKSVHEDTDGTLDAGHRAFYSYAAVRKGIEVWTGTKWVPIRSAAHAEAIDARIGFQDPDPIKKRRFKRTVDNPLANVD